MISKEAFFIEAISLFCSSLDITIAMSRLLRFLNTVMSADAMMISYIDREMKRIKEVAVATSEKSEYTNESMPLHLDMDELAEKYDKSRPLVINDMANDEITRENFRVEAKKRGVFPDFQASAILLMKSGSESFISLPPGLEDSPGSMRICWGRCRSLLPWWSPIAFNTRKSCACRRC